MLHTDTLSILIALKQQECEELKQAIWHHQGAFSWENSDMPPVIAVNLNGYTTGPIDVVITKVQIMGNRQLKIEGVDKEQHHPVKLKIADIPVGQLGYIIDCIPPVNRFFSVACPIKFLLWGETT